MRLNKFISESGLCSRREADRFIERGLVLLISEKLRALKQRSYTAPCDFYDIWYLANNQLTIDWKEIKDAFHVKMNFKNLEFEGIHQMMNESNDKQVKAGWKNSLAHQIPGGIKQSYDEVK